jgi:hypothetical protein
VGGAPRYQREALTSPSMSRSVTVATDASPCSATSALALRVRTAWNSNENTCPVGATARASACVNDPLPVPAERGRVEGVS